MYKSVHIAEIVGVRQGHVAIGALLRVRWVVERTGSLARDAAGLPVVVFVEATNPTIMVHRNVEVHLVATGAELRGLGAHERPQKDSAVRFRIQFHQKIMHTAHDWVLACGHLVKLGIFQIKICLAHRAFYFRDGVAHHAAESCL